MPLSAHEQRVLAEIQRELDGDPDLSATLRTGGAPWLTRRQVPIWAGLFGALTLLLAVLALHPLVVELGMFGVGLLTAALVVPWLLLVNRSITAQTVRTDPSDAPDRAAVGLPDASAKDSGKDSSDPDDDGPGPVGLADAGPVRPG